MSGTVLQAQLAHAIDLALDPSEEIQNVLSVIPVIGWSSVCSINCCVQSGGEKAALLSLYKVAEKWAWGAQ